MSNNLPLKNQQRFNGILLLRRRFLIGAIFAASFSSIHGNVIECGTVNLFRGLVLGGNDVLRDQWPFIAALYHSRQLKYFCGGTIISNIHVLTGIFSICLW